MIIHGNKQISGIIYSRKALDGGGAVALTNIIRGPQVVFGGLEPKVYGWLSAATKAAILAAFGQDDGKAVIKATNRYLTQLAASDRDKATALAGLINEDPMMVCSLGLSVEGVTMPIRFLKGDGTGSAGAYLKTNLYPSSNVTIDIMFKLGSTNDNYCGVFGGCSSSGKFELNYWYSSNLYFHGSTAVATGISTSKVYRFIDLGSTQRMYQDGVLTGTFNVNKGTYTSNTPFSLFCLNRGNTVGWRGPHLIAYANVKDGNNELQLYPFIRKIDGVDKLGMIDAVNNVFYQNAGSGAFTISYTRNGQPWTPQTP